RCSSCRGLSLFAARCQCDDVRRGGRSRTPAAIGRCDALHALFHAPLACPRGDAVTCRIFSFRSVLQSQVHRSLTSADNALPIQSEAHSDGWGVAYYVAGAPHVIKSVNTAMSDNLFHRVSGVVTSETVLAHLRKATQGQLSTINTHPFQHGHWVFAHNGNIAGFPSLRRGIVERIPPVLRRFILGDTDSEALYYLILGKMAERCELHRPGFALRDLAAAVQ